jgi:hypothetical protein
VAGCGGLVPGFAVQVSCGSTAVAAKKHEIDRLRPAISGIRADIKLKDIACPRLCDAGMAELVHVYEDVGTAVVSLQKPKAFVGLPEFYGACRHFECLLCVVSGDWTQQMQQFETLTRMTRQWRFAKLALALFP